MNKMLITGGAGFLGKRLVPELQKKYDLYCLVRNKTDLYCKMVRGDLLNLDIQNNNYSSIIHMAANTKFNDEGNYNVNITKNILEFAVNNDIKRFYFMSTAFVCGDHEGKFGHEELDVGQGFNNNYERSKFLSEKLVRSYMDRLDITIFRPSIVIESDKFEDSSGFNTILWALKNNLFPKFPGRPENKIYVIDCGLVVKNILQNLSNDTIGKTIQIINHRLLGELVSYYSILFKVKKPEFIDVNGFREMIKNNKKLLPLFYLLPYIDTKVDFC